MCNCNGNTYIIHREFVTASNFNFGVKGSGILMQNQGEHPVYINDFVLLPGDAKKFDIMPPHIIEDSLNIRFDTLVSLPATSIRLSPGPKLYIEYLAQKNG